MAPSYKTLWQEAQTRIDKLTRENERLSRLLALHPDESLRQLERTREIVDLAGIARHMKVARYTPQQWNQRGHLPPVDFPLIREPLWYATTVKEKFAIPTHRIWYDDPDAGEPLSQVA